MTDSPETGAASYEAVAAYLVRYYAVTDHKARAVLDSPEGRKLLGAGCIARELTDAVGDRIAWKQGWMWKEPD
jgi:hypothetical protein